MINSIIQICCQLARFIFVVCLLVTIAACSGVDESEDKTGGNIGNNNAPGGNTSQLTVNLGDDINLPRPGKVSLNAGKTLATRFRWEQISSGTRVNLLNADQRIVTFLTPDFSATSPVETRKITLRLTVGDDSGQEAYDDIVITVPPNLQPQPGSNNPPVIENIPDVIAGPGETVQLTAVATDFEDGAPAIHWYKITGPELGLTEQQLNSNSITFTAPTAPAKIWFIVEATDSSWESEQTDVLVEVTGNVPPTANAGGDMTVISGQQVSIQGSGSDSDGTITQYLWQRINGPNVTLQNANTDRVSFTAPAVSVPAIINLQLMVTDNLGATAIDQINVTVNPSLENIPPTANAGADKVVNPGEVVTVVGSGTDNDGSVTAYSWQQLSGPPITLNGQNTQAASFTMPVNMQGSSEIKLQLTVTDNQGATGIDEISIKANFPPVVDAGGDQFVQAGDTVNLVGTATDDIDSKIVNYLWTQVAGPNVTLIDPNSSSTSFIAPAISGSITLRLFVTDSNGAVGSDDIVVTVNPANIPPAANAGPDLTVASGSKTPVTITGNGNDTDGSIVSYQWTQVAGPAVNLSGTNTDTVSFNVPSVSVTTIIRLRLTVTDDAGATAFDEVSVTINTSTANNPPTANAGVDQVVAVGDLVSLSGNGSTSNGGTLSYLWTKISGPAITLNNANTPVATFIAPQVNSVTNMTMQLTVTDQNGATGTDQVVITIQPLNNPPVANAGPDQSVSSGQTVTVSGSATDADGTIAQYQWTQLAGPNVSLTNANTANVRFTAPAVTSTTAITLRLTVTDNQGASAFDDVVITISGGGSGNQAPVANAGPDLDAIAGETVTIAGSGVDDGNIIVYIWTQLTGGPAVNLVNAATPTVSFTAPVVAAPTAITLRLTLVDDLGATGTDDVVITVNPSGANVPPSANAGPDLSVTQGSTVNISGSGNDSDGSISSYQWTQRNGINVSLTDANTANVRFTAPSVATPSAITLRLTVTDNAGATGFDDVVVTINPSTTNTPPTANAGPDINMNSGTTVTINGSGSDPGGSISSYQWQRLSGINLTLTGTANPSLQVTAPNVISTGVATLRLTVTDNLGATAFDDVVVTVVPSNVNQPPVANAGADQSVNIFDLVTLQGSGTDPDGSIASYQWTQTGTPAVSITNATSANATFSAPNVTSATQLTFQLTVVDNGGLSNTDVVTVTVYPLASISGTVTAASGALVDSDVNDTAAVFIRNNTVADAQALFNPVVVGGYVNIAGQGPNGRLRSAGDLDDYYSISLSANQVITLYIGNSSGADLDLYLYNQNNQLVDSSVSPNANESLVVPATGSYYIDVKAVSGASNYVLSVGVAGASVQSNGWRVSDDFEAGDVIVQFDDSNVTAAGFTTNTLASRASSVGLQAKAGAPGRSMLLGLGNPAQRAAAFGKLAIQQNTVATADPLLQDKLDTLLAAKSLARRTDVVEVSPNYRYYPTLVPNDANYSRQWHYPSINLPQAWDITTGSSNVIVAVIDTGVLLNHPDLQGQLVAGYDFIADDANSGDGQRGIDPDPNDPGDGGGTSSSSFHGTHVSGTIAAASNNSTGVAGIAWGVKIMPCRAIGINGGLRYDIEQCVRFVSGLSNDSGTLPARRADIINLSLGGPTNTTSAPAAYRDARNQGVIVVAAAGNNASSELFAPAAYNGVVSVSATNISRRLASYSNFGSTIDVAAPGGDSGDLNGDGFFDGVLSTSGDDSSGSVVFNYRFAAGTSMASPHMAGVVALMKSVYPGLTPAILDTMLANGELTDDAGTAGRDNSFGYGIINAQKAVQAAANAASPTPTPPPPQPAALQVTPTSLNFGSSLSTADINVVNAGGGTLNITNITNDSGGWLTVTPVTVGTTGLGTYQVAVNRIGLLAGVYTATISIVSSAGTQSVSAIMQVNAVATNDSAGNQYIELIDVTTMEVFDRVSTRGTNGVYQYTFPGVPLGTYHIRAGSDLDFDGILCELGDACGAYPTLDLLSRHIVVDETVRSLTGLDFITDFRVNLTTQQ